MIFAMKPPSRATRRAASPGPPGAARAFAHAALAFAVLAAGGAGAARAARGDVDVFIAPDRTEAGKNYVPPTAQTPYYCMIHGMGAMEMGDRYAGEKIPRLEEVAPFVKKALAGQHYLEIDSAHPEPSLVIAYSWGSINSDDFAKQQNEQEMLSIIGIHRMDLSPKSLDREFYLPSLKEGRYFILVAAYDYALLKAGVKRSEAMLWRTRLSTYNIGEGIMSLARMIPLMLETGASAFGSESYPLESVNRVKKGVVTIGEAEVLEYITSGTGARPAPAKPEKAAPGAATSKKK